MTDFSLEAVLRGELTEPTLRMRLPDAAETCRQAMYALNCTADEAKRLTAFASKALIMYERQKNTIQFPGGSVSIETDRVERKLSEFLGPGRSCKVSYVNREWTCWLYVGAEHHMARSRIGLLDAIANALMVAEVSES